MKKRLIALTLTLALLISVSPTVFADDTSARPTVEEILSDYHQAAFEAETSGEASASTYSRSGSAEQTLEQQTVNTLNEAGYEAYNVTADNYDTLEEQLQTDFSEMGLDRDGSYIVVIHGEEENSTNGNARLGDITLPPHLRDDGYGDGESTFTYTYNGTSYTMRYLTVTSADRSDLSSEVIYTLPKERIGDFWSELPNAVLYHSTQAEAESTPICSILFLLFDVIGDDNYYRIESDSLFIHARSEWTLNYIQVQNPTTNTWFSAQCSEYAVSAARCMGSTYNYDTEEITFHEGNAQHFKTYSPNYSDTDQRKLWAAQAYISGAAIGEFTDEIYFLLMDPTGTTNYCGDGNILFTQHHWCL